MTAEEAWEAAAAEGLTLVRSECISGFQYVISCGAGFKARFNVRNFKHHSKLFETAEEAALDAARALARRWPKLYVTPPSVDEAVEMDA